MAKLIAIVNVVAWSGFWVFGYLALTAGEGQALTAVILAAFGAGLGVLAWIWLARHSEEIGFARAPNRGAMPMQEADR